MPSQGNKNRLVLAVQQHWNNQQHCWLLVSNLISLAYWLMPIGVAVIIIIIITITLAGCNVLLGLLACLRTSTAHSLCYRVRSSSLGGRRKLAEQKTRKERKEGSRHSPEPRLMALEKWTKPTAFDTDSRSSTNAWQWQ